MLFVYNSRICSISIKFLNLSKILPKKINELRFLHLKIRSLSKKISLLEELTSSYKISPAIVGVYETKWNKNINLDSKQVKKNI